MTDTAVIKALRANLELEAWASRRDMSTLATATPKVLDGHSDGRRVKYVRAEVRAAVIAEVIAMLDNGGAA